MKKNAILFESYYSGTRFLSTENSNYGTHFPGGFRLKLLKNDPGTSRIFSQTSFPAGSLSFRMGRVGENPSLTASNFI